MTETCFTSREEWLAARKYGVGGSEIAAICGLNPPGWATAFDVWADKLGLVPPRPPSLRMRLGSFLEPFILDEYAALTGRAVKRCELSIHFDTDFPFAFASPDAFEVESGDGVEAKSVGRADDDWGEDETDRIPPHYLAQVTWQMGVCRRDCWHVAALFPNLLRVYTVRFDRVFFATMYARAERFWRDHVAKQEPPPMRGTTVDDYLKGRFPIDKVPLRQASEIEVQKAEALLTIKERITEFEGLAETYTNELKQDIGEAAGIEWERGRVLWTLVEPEPKPDWRAIAQSLNPTPEVVAAATVIPTPYRRFLPTRRKEKKNG